MHDGSLKKSERENFVHEKFMGEVNWIELPRMPCDATAIDG